MALGAGGDTVFGTEAAATLGAATTLETAALGAVAATTLGAAGAGFGAADWPSTLLATAATVAATAGGGVEEEAAAEGFRPP